MQRTKVKFVDYVYVVITVSVLAAIGGITIALCIRVNEAAKFIPTGSEIQAQITKYNCKRTGFAGKYAEGVYTCNNGELFLYGEMEALARKEKQK